jgi:pSer/pThr/pTyr-binding forkhead associated (FHA) protein
MWILKSDAAATIGPLTFRVTPGATKTLGRAPQADFIVEATLVSRLHCRLVANGNDGLEVEDLGSTNGTYVNGQRVQRATLSAGDRLRVGQLELVVERTGRPL